MTMQYDVKQAHLNQSGFMVPYRTRVKAISFVGSTSAGQFTLFDTLTAPVTSATYGRSGTTVTVASTAHGLTTGQTIGIDFNAGTGGAATPGNYVITRVDANTFTLTDINTGTITATPGCQYTAAGFWLMTCDVAANDTFNNSLLLPGEGVLARNGVYVYMGNLVAVSIFYG